MPNNLFLKVSLAVIAALLAANLFRNTAVHAQTNHAYSVMALPDASEGGMGNRGLSPTFQVPGRLLASSALALQLIATRSRRQQSIKTLADPAVSDPALRKCIANTWIKQYIFATQESPKNSNSGFGA